MKFTSIKIIDDSIGYYMKKRKNLYEPMATYASYLRANSFACFTR